MRPARRHDDSGHERRKRKADAARARGDALFHEIGFVIAIPLAAALIVTLLLRLG